MDENPNISDAEYQDWLHSQGYAPVTQEDIQSQHIMTRQKSSKLILCQDNLRK